MENSHNEIGDRQEVFLYVFILFSGFLVLLASVLPFEVRALEAESEAAEITASSASGVNLTRLVRQIAMVLPFGDDRGKVGLEEGSYWVLHSTRNEKQALAVVKDCERQGFNVVHLKISMNGSAFYRVILADVVDSDSEIIDRREFQLPEPYKDTAWITNLRQPFVVIP